MLLVKMYNMDGVEIGEAEEFKTHEGKEGEVVLSRFLMWGNHSPDEIKAIVLTGTNEDEDGYDNQVHMKDFYTGLSLVREFGDHYPRRTLEMDFKTHKQFKDFIEVSLRRENG